MRFEKLYGATDFEFKREESKTGDAFWKLKWQQQDQVLSEIAEHGIPDGGHAWEDAQRAERIWKQETIWEEVTEAEDGAAWLSIQVVGIIHPMERWTHSWEKSRAKGTEAILKNTLGNFSKLAEK